MKTKILRRIISVICAVGMSASCATGFVGAIKPEYREQYKKMKAKIAKIDEEIKKEK